MAKRDGTIKRTSIGKGKVIKEFVIERICYAPDKKGNCTLQLPNSGECKRCILKKDRI